jgi:hypothetical protein
MSVSVKSRVPEVKNAVAERKQRALSTVGETVSGEAKKLSPVAAYQGGRLRSSITYAFDGKPPVYVNTEEVAPGIQRNGRAPKDTVLIGTNVVYARYQHEGLSPKGRQLKYQMPKAESKFLKKAVQRNRDKIKRDIMRALEGKLELQP